MAFDDELAGVLKPAIKNDIDTVEAKTLRGLYEIKKKDLGLSDRKIQSMLGMQKGVIDPILDGTTKQINLVNFIKVSNFLGIDFGDLAIAYLPKMGRDTIGEIQQARDAGFLAETFDLATLMKVGFLHSDDTKKINERITMFFGIRSIYEYSKIGSSTAFSRTKRTSNDKMRDFWVRSAFTQFKAIANPHPYDRAKLLSLMPKIRSYSRNEEHGLVAVIKALYTVGVTVIYQPHIGKEQVRGATMCVKGQPCVVISNLNNKYPTLWFALLHELYHVLFDLEDIEAEAYHVSDGEGDLMLTNEDKADNFARQYMLSDEKFNFISAYINAPTMVRSYAQDWGIHPSFIYATFCYRHNRWAKFSHYIPNMDKALKTINTFPFEKESLVENAKRIKELLTI